LKESDIENSYIAEEKDTLRDLRERFRATFEQAAVGIAHVAPDGTWLRVNKKLCEIVGYTKEELLKKTFQEITYKDDLEKDVNYARQMLAGEIKTYTTEKRYCRKNGEIIWIELTVSLVRDSKGNPKYFISVVNDINKRKKAEAKLHKQQSKLEAMVAHRTAKLKKINEKLISEIKEKKNTEQKLHEVLEYSVNLFYTHGPDQVLTYVSPQSRQFLGCEPEEAKIRWTEFITNNPINLRGIELTNRAIDTGNAQPPYELELRKKNGDIIWVEVNEAPLVKNGKTVSIVGSLTDITEKKQAYEAIKKNEHLMRASQRIAKLGHYSLDIPGGNWESSEVLDKIFGIDKTYQTNIEGWLQIVHPDYKDKMRTYLTNEVFSKHKPFDAEYKIVRINDDAVRWVHSVGELVFDENKNLIRMIGTCQDITEMKKAEDELRMSQKQLAHAVDVAQLGPWEYDALEDQFIFNDHFYKLFHTTVEEVGSYTMTPSDYANRFLFPEDVHLIAEEMKLAFETKDPNLHRQLEHRIKYPDGTAGYITVDYFITKDSSGRTIGTYGVNQNITERKLAEEKIKQSEQDYRRLFENAHDAIFIINPEDEVILDVNERACKIYGFSKSEFIGMSLEAISKNVSEGKKKIEKTLREGYINSFETVQFTKQDKERIFEVNASLIDYKGKKAILSLNHDITDRKAFEEELKRSEEKYRNIFNNSPIGIYRTTPDGRILDANPAILKMLQYSSLQELTQKNLEQEKSYGEDSTRQKFKKLIEQDDKIKGFESIWLRKDNSEVHVRENASAIKDNLGNTLYYEGTVEDITDYKIAQKRLRESEELYRSLAESAEFAIFIYDKNLNYRYINKFAAKQLGLKPSDVVGKNIKDFFPPELVTGFIENMSKVLSEGVIVNEETLMRFDKDAWIATQLVPLRDELGNVNSILGISQDITERKKAEQEIIAAKEKAEEMNRLKSNFLANMSHELRTPLVGIVGFAEFLCADLTNPELKEMAQAIYDSSKRLSETLNMILDLSKIETNNVAIIPEKFDAVTASLEIVNSFKEFANKKGIYLKSTFESPKFIVNLNIRSFRSILNNLVNNAIKFTNAGGVTVNLSQNNVDGKDFVAIKIIDTGIGISKKNHDVIFEEFRQVSEGFDRNFEGSGLGLSITKKLAEKLDGTLSVESELGKGSTFTVLLPLAEKLPTAATNRVDSEKEIKPLESSHLPSVLIVDDDKNINIIVKSYLHPKFDVTFVENAYDAIELIKQKKFDVVLMDINLKEGIDGKKATQSIRKIKGYENTPIVACTAYAMAGDKEEFLSGGCSHYISKPFSKEDINFLLNEILQQGK
jgi:PAS domain S-box-containing protein